MYRVPEHPYELEQCLQQFLTVQLVVCDVSLTLLLLKLLAVGAHPGQDAERRSRFSEEAPVVSVLLTVTLFVAKVQLPSA